MPRRSSLTAVGAYIFAGGFTLGVKRAGFDVLAQLEDGDFGVETTRRNHPGLRVETALHRWPLAELSRKRVDFIYGNPPCAPWSVAGISHRNKGDQFRTKYKRDPRTSCVYALYNLLVELEPKAWAWESVTPALTKGYELVQELTEGAVSRGYNVTYVLLNAVDIGVPQSRYRFFFLAHKHDIPWEYPRVARPTTVGEALAPLGEPDFEEHYPMSKAFVELMPHVRPGEGLQGAWNRLHPPHKRKLNARGHVIGRPAFTQLRLDWNKPAPTMIGGAHQFHPFEDRALSVREAQVLCGYPPDYEFVGRLGDRYCQIARAVMPSVGEWLAMNVRRGIEQGKRTRRPSVWLRNFHRDKYHEVNAGHPPSLR